jgi:hypothetical protein
MESSNDDAPDRADGGSRSIIPRLASPPGEGDTPSGDVTLSEARRSVRARHLPGPRIIQRAWRALPGCQHQRWPARLQVTA